MKRSRFTEEQIISILREQESGAAVAEVCRRHGVSSATFYKWKAKLEAGLPAELLETRHVRTAFKIMPVKTDRKDAQQVVSRRQPKRRVAHCAGSTFNSDKRELSPYQAESPPPDIGGIPVRNRCPLMPRCP